MTNKKELCERDICTKFILQALQKVGWDDMSQVRDEFEISRGADHRPRQAGRARPPEVSGLRAVLQAQHSDSGHRGQEQ